MHRPHVAPLRPVPHVPGSRRSRWVSFAIATASFAGLLALAGHVALTGEGFVPPAPTERSTPLAPLTTDEQSALYHACREQAPGQSWSPKRVRFPAQRETIYTRSGGRVEVVLTMTEPDPTTEKDRTRRVSCTLEQGVVTTVQALPMDVPWAAPRPNEYGLNTTSGDPLTRKLNTVITECARAAGVGQTITLAQQVEVHSCADRGMRLYR